MFNIGKGRIYTSAANTKDILNLAGVDVKTYGSVHTGSNQFEDTQGNVSGSEAGTGTVHLLVKIIDKSLRHLKMEKSQTVIATMLDSSAAFN